MGRGGLGVSRHCTWLAATDSHIFLRQESLSIVVVPSTLTRLLSRCPPLFPQEDEQNQKALLQQWLALHELGETTEAVKSLAVIERAPLEGTKLGNLQPHKAILTAYSEEERERCA